MHPCHRCGACCAFFKVSFDSSEMHPDSLQVPAELQLTSSLQVSTMRGTEARPVRCVALDGTIGKSVSCSIYHRRPSPCRKFKASYENGKKNPRCDLARRMNGLKPLTPSVWRKQY